jgi:hypothetical protein
MQFELALQCYQQCVVLLPDNPSALTALGFTDTCSATLMVQSITIIKRWR